MGAHSERKNGVQDNVAHKTIIISGLRGDAPRNFLMLMILGTRPGSKIIEKPLMICHDAPLFLDRFPFMVHTKCTTINQHARHVESCDEVKNWLLGPTQAVSWPFKGYGTSPLANGLCNLHEV